MYTSKVYGRDWNALATSQRLERDRLKATSPAIYIKNLIDIKITEKLLLNATIYQ